MTPDAKDKLQAAVNSLARMSPDEIAAHIQKLGIKGRLGTTYKCPLANLLSSQFGGQFIIGRTKIARRMPEGSVSIPTPKALATFVRKFDIVQYPMLISPPPRCERNEGSPAKRKHSGKHKTKRKYADHPHVLRSKRVIKHRIAAEVGRFA